MLMGAKMPHRKPLPKICIALGFSDAAALISHARHEYEAGERFFEFRLDYLPNPDQGFRAISDFLSAQPDCAILATCRRHQNHGRFNGSIDEQIRVLNAAIDAGAQAVDVEVETAENISAHLDEIRGKTTLVVSFHDFGGTPALDSLVRRMSRIPADAYKIVTTARKPSDNFRILNLTKTFNKLNLIVLAMGEIGFPTRVLSTAFGGVYTYAAPNSAEGTATGQVSARTLRQLYRVEKFSRAAKVYGVVADPVRHSVSPAVHNRAFQARRMDAVYLPFLVAPQHLKDFFMFADKLPVTGFSVTIPHKQKVLRYLDIIDPLARRIGAVNTVWKKAGKWRGANTDAEGVTVPLSKVMRVPKSTVLLAGNGGAARSAAYALTAAGAAVSIVGRNPDRVRALAKACGAEALSREDAESKDFDAVVHATPVGMYPHTCECFFERRIPGAVVFDMVYNPMETVLVRRAMDEGKTTVGGLQMFIEQACRQFEIWTGENAPRAVMERAAVEALGLMGAQAAAESGN